MSIQVVSPLSGTGVATASGATASCPRAGSTASAISGAAARRTLVNFISFPLRIFGTRARPVALYAQQLGDRGRRSLLDSNRRATARAAHKMAR